MPVYAVYDETWNRAAPLTEGDTWRVNNNRIRVKASTPNDPLLYVEVDDPAILQRLKDRGEIRDFGPERTDFHHMAILPPDDKIIEVRDFKPQEMGDTAQLMLERVEELRAACNEGDGAAIIDYDTGCQTSHEEFSDTAFLVPQRGYDDVDQHGHGTFTMGQMKHLLPKAKFIPIKLLGGANGSGTESDIVNQLHRGLEYWRSLGTPIAAANNSWGSDGGSDGIDTAFRYCHQNGLYMTNAQGNSGSSVRSPGSPTRAARFVAAAMDRNLRNASFTSGLDTWPITTAWYCGVDEWGPSLGGGYRLMSGTSMADPWLTCTVVMLRLLHPDWVEEQILSYILTHAQALATPARNGRGHGVIGMDAIPTPQNPPVDPPIQPPDNPPANPEMPPQLQYIVDVAFELEAISKRTQDSRTKLEAVTPASAKPIIEETFREIGAIQDYAQGQRASALQVATLLSGNPDNPNNPPNPPPVTDTLPPGTYTFKYGDAERQYVQVVITPNHTDEVDLILAGGAWQMGGDPGAIPLDDAANAFAPREVQQWYLNNGHIMVMGAYPLGDIAFATNSARAMLKWIAANCVHWGGSPQKITVAGHSAGAHAVAAAACDPGAPTVRGIVVLSGACFYIDETWANTQLARIIAKPWGPPSNWRRWSIHTLLNSAPRPLKFYAVHGRMDDQIPLQMMQWFAQYAVNHGHVCELTVINGGHGEPGSTRFPEVQAAFRKAWNS